MGFSTETYIFICWHADVQVTAYTIFLSSNDWGHTMLNICHLMMAQYWNLCSHSIHALLYVHLLNQCWCCQWWVQTTCGSNPTPPTTWMFCKNSPQSVHFKIVTQCTWQWYARVQALPEVDALITCVPLSDFKQLRWLLRDFIFQGWARMDSALCSPGTGPIKSWLLFW